MGLLHARLVLSPYAHAVIERIDTEAAGRILGVKGVLAAGDLPIVASGDARLYEPLARREAVFSGQPVALVIADTETAAEDGAAAVAIDYRPMDAVLDTHAAMAKGAAQARARHKDADAGSDARAAHAAVGGGAQSAADEDLSANVVGRHIFTQGNASELLDSSDIVVEGHFSTPWMYQAYLEPQVATAWTDEAGDLVVASSTQGIFYTRQQLAKLFGLPVSRVRVQATPLGGAFGGKLLVIEPLVAAAALRFGRPVRLSLTRNEDFNATNPASASAIHVRIGASVSGQLRALDARVVFDAGAFSEWTIEQIAAVMLAGPYRWSAYSVQAYGVETNRCGVGSYRAPGAPQAAFAIESLIDELGIRLALDPIQLRLKNLALEGDHMIDGTTWPRVGTQECLEHLAAHPIWLARERLPEGEGVGVAVACWPGGNEPAAALCRLDSDGTLTVVTAAVDMSGTTTVFAAIAAEAFGVSAERVRVVAGDTSNAPYAPITGGSKTTYTVGRAVQQAALQARDQLLQVAAAELEISPEDLEIVDNLVRPVGAPSRAVSVATLAERSVDFTSPYKPIEGYSGSAQHSLAPSVAAHLLRVSLDKETGRVRLLNHVVAQDVGRAINPGLVKGQIHGGAVQGVGWALYEELRHDDDGQLLSGSFLSYLIPSASDVTEVETILLEVPATDGPFGAKGMAEAPVIAAAPAIANAVVDAGGPRIHELPLTPERVWQALKQTDSPKGYSGTSTATGAEADSSRSGSAALRLCGFREDEGTRAGRHFHGGDNLD